MDAASIKNVFEGQRKFFQSQKTKEYFQRIQILQQLKDLILRHETSLVKALQVDMGKPAIEAAGGEVWYVLEEIDYTIKKLKGWMKPRRKRTPLLHFWSKSMVYPEPYGQVLIIAPWNYPFHLLFSPLVGAIAAGNTAILKPSELAPHTAQVVERMISTQFNPEIIAVVNGGVETSTALLSLPFNYIFFTGSTRVGKIVMKAAAEHLTPVTLELGGKSPVIVDESADLAIAVKRITWGKFFNAGQTCIAPDYVLVHEKVHDQFVLLLKEAIRSFYGEDPKQSPDLARIINKATFDRLVGLINQEKVVIGGNFDPEQLYIAPTILDQVSIEDEVMQEEIFGPILPVLAYKTMEDVKNTIQMYPDPLTLYLFTRNKEVEARVVAEIPYGGGCVNDTISHIYNEEIPFGGRGTSGMGAYHGKISFDTFSHQKSVLFRKTWPDIPLRYPPYRIAYEHMKKLFKLGGWHI